MPHLQNALKEEVKDCGQVDCTKVFFDALWARFHLLLRCPQ